MPHWEKKMSIFIQGIFFSVLYWVMIRNRFKVELAPIKIYPELKKNFLFFYNKKKYFPNIKKKKVELKSSIFAIYIFLSSKT